MKRMFAPLIAVLFILPACTQPDDGGGGECTIDSDCGDTAIYFCDKVNHECKLKSGVDIDQSDGADDGNTGIIDDDQPDPSEVEGPDGDGPMPDVDYAGLDCAPGATETCNYTGQAGTENVGPCKAGMRTCKEDGTWSGCNGEVRPLFEICDNGADEDCNGTVDDGSDMDGDGYTYCAEDCCDSPGDCPNPAMVHPGAYEVVNDIDDNCNGETDEKDPACDTGVTVSQDVASSAVSLARSAGFCEPWLLSAQLGLAGPQATEYICDSGGVFSCPKYNRLSLPFPYFDGTYQTYAVNPKFGNAIEKKQGDNIAILSTGPWDGPTKDASVATLAAGDMKTASTVPEDWINFQPNCTAPKAPSCGGAAPDPTTQNSCAGKALPVVQDPIMLTVRLKVPPNAGAFRINTYFCSVEYPDTVCSSSNYNDFFIALLDSTFNQVNPTSEHLNPYDKNLAKDVLGNPVGVDLAPAGLFTVCSEENNNWGFCTGDAELAGTGFDNFGGCGCTGWLVTQGNVVPGEEITLRFAVFEQGTVSYGPDHSWDSTILLDNFEWLADETTPGTGIQE